MNQATLHKLQDFGSFSLKMKLMLIIFSISALALVFASLLDVVLSWNLERKQIMRRMEANATIISIQSQAALEFADPIAANEILASLHPNPAIQRACLYNELKEPFGAYERDNPDATCPPIQPPGRIKTWQRLKIYKEIWSGERFMGALYLEYSLKEMYQNLLRETLYKWSFLLLILALVWPLSSYLQRIISRPVMQLAAITRRFSKDRSQPLYAEKISNDELGQLVDAFNIMMEEIRRNEGRMNEAIEELSRSNTELERFAYICSHDLQEPLRMILNYSKMLENRYREKLDGEATVFLDFITDSAARMRELINDVLTYSRISHHVEPRQDVDTNALVEYVLKNLSTSIAEQGAVVEKGKLPTLKANKTLLGQIFQNLISNAIKFCKNQPKVTIKAERRGKAWQFSIHDNGIGIDPRYHDRIFEIFKRLNRREEYRGTGIGLAICKKAVEYHGGKIWLESAEGEGTTFFFTIPD